MRRRANTGDAVGRQWTKGAGGMEEHVAPLGRQGFCPSSPRSRRHDPSIDADFDTAAMRQAVGSRALTDITNTVSNMPIRAAAVA